MLARELERAGLPAISGPNSLVVRFPIGYNSAREYCQQPTSVARVEEVLRRVTGNSCTLRFDSAGPEVLGPQAEAGSSGQAPSRSQRQRAEALKVPLVKRAVEILGAQLVNVDEGFGGGDSGSPDRPGTADFEEE
jgi:hypothetical protein